METINNRLNEELSYALVVALGEREALKGWTLRHDAKYHNALTAGASAATRAIGRQTSADIEAGWNSSGPLADQIRRKNGSPVAIAQSGQDVPSRFGIEGEEWVRLRWARSNWAKRRTQGWSGRAVCQWLTRKRQDQNPKDICSVGCPAWYAEHQP